MFTYNFHDKLPKYHSKLNNWEHIVILEKIATIKKKYN